MNLKQKPIEAVIPNLMRDLLMNDLKYTNTVMLTLIQHLWAFSLTAISRSKAQTFDNFSWIVVGYGSQIPDNLRSSLRSHLKFQE